MSDRPTQKPASAATAFPGNGVRALLLVASGTAALVFQVLWIKQLTLIVGVDVYAVTTGVSAFFGGLAFGGLVLGRKVDRALRPLRWYAALETGVALLGVAITATLAHIAPLFATLANVSNLLAWPLIFLLVGLAPFLKCGTLPAIVRSLRLPAGQIGSGGGRMYAANTAGAILGALVASFVLIHQFGVQGTAFAACRGSGWWAQPARFGWNFPRWGCGAPTASRLPTAVRAPRLQSQIKTRWGQRVPPQTLPSSSTRSPAESPSATRSSGHNPSCNS